MEGRVYPIFTDGERFYHSSENHPEGKDIRFGYWSKYPLKEWRKIEKPKLTKEMAKNAMRRWIDMEKEIRI